MSMKALRLNGADIILQNFELGQGKIIISEDNYGYKFSYYWGSMGERSIEEFICKINSDYFVHNLSNRVEGEINTKKTLTNIRKSIREHLNTAYPWYKHRDFQTSLRETINNLEYEGFNSNDDFIHKINYMVEWNIDFYEIDDKFDEKYIREIIENLIFSEPWYYLVYDKPREHVYLEKLFKALVKELKKPDVVLTEIELVK